MSGMDKGTINDLHDLLDEAQGHLFQAIQYLRSFSDRAEGATAAAAESYIIAHLKDWAKNEKQCGSIPDLRSRLEDDEERIGR